MSQFQPPVFRPHRLVPGGHLQTILAVSKRGLPILKPQQHRVFLPDGDAIVLHEDRPDDWQPGDPAVLLVHGLGGCYQSPYMLRLADRFLRRGILAYRMDMRGCGAASPLATQLAHAGRSDDVIAALDFIAGHAGAGELYAVGVSLGGNQVLRAAGRIGSGKDERPGWFDRLGKIAAVSPPVDLERCSENMQRLSRRFYNYYFIRMLLSQVPQKVRAREDFQCQLALGRPRTLRELDDRLTAPLSGFHDASEYYDRSSAIHDIADNPLETLVLAASDDPLVPVDCFSDDRGRWPAATRRLIVRSGGHVGFISRDGSYWMDDVLEAWFR